MSKNIQFFSCDVSGNRCPEIGPSLLFCYLSAKVAGNARNMNVAQHPIIHGAIFLLEIVATNKVASLIRLKA